MPVVVQGDAAVHWQGRNRSGHLAFLLLLLLCGGIVRLRVPGLHALTLANGLACAGGQRLLRAQERHDDERKQLLAWFLSP